ncbi:MAG: NAD(P)-dependent oxidoreductase, partial [Lachnospiraceae bacterium]|nr:NAD(P)-dependent oxidoreductase [Lachnospiraceae bacterium]
MKVGFVGLGNMGYNMVNNLIKNGFEVYTYDVFKKAVERTEEIGAHGVSDLRELGEIADVVQVMVMNYEQVNSVVAGEGGLLETMKPDSIISVSSTVSPAQTRSVAEKAAKKGVRYSDCPVSGGKTGAINGELVIMAACSDDVFEVMEPVYRAMGKHATYHVSDIVGNGQVMKSINQVMIATNMAIAAEAVTYAVKSGLHPEDIYEVIGKCTGCSDVFRDKLPLIMERDFAVRGQIDIFLKDLSIALDIGKEVRSPMFMSALTKQVFTWASA